MSKIKYLLKVFDRYIEKKILIILFEQKIFPFFVCKYADDNS